METLKLLIQNKHADIDMKIAEDSGFRCLKQNISYERLPYTQNVPFSQWIWCQRISLHLFTWIVHLIAINFANFWLLFTSLLKSHDSKNLCNIVNCQQILTVQASFRGRNWSPRACPVIHGVQATRSFEDTFSNSMKRPGNARRWLG